MSMEIRIAIVATYSNGLDKESKWYEWKLFNEKGKPIAKSHMNFQQKRSAIKAAKRMKDIICPMSDDPSCEECEEQFLPIYDMSKTFKKILIDGCDCSHVIPV